MTCLRVMPTKKKGASRPIASRELANSKKPPSGFSLETFFFVGITTSDHISKIDADKKKKSIHPRKIASEKTAKPKMIKAY